MRRISFAATAVLMSLAMGAVPVIGQETSPEVSPATPSPSPPATIGEPADGGARIVAAETVDGRTRDLTIESPAVGTVQVRLLLPATFEEGASERYPVLYLLHGGGGGHTDWTKNTDVEGMTASAPLLVAMPAAASSNLGTSEAGRDGEGGLPNWETFHVVELPQLLERNWQAGDERAIGGLSLGGYGAMRYAGRHPDLFRAVASYSGVLDLAVSPDVSAEVQALADQARQLAEAAGWEDPNPVTLVPSLEGMAVYISYGNGAPGPLDDASADLDVLEEWVSQGDDNFVAALSKEGVAAMTSDYGAGSHSWSYWDRELCASLPLLLEALGESAATPCTASTP
jgi:diacylglycerol O-acyltransferase/trehalose O-mycolyltransferase